MTTESPLWAVAARSLARRTTWRTRAGAVLLATAIGVGVGALAAGAIRAFVEGVSPATPVAMLAAAGLAGCLAGTRAAARVLPTRVEDAAWALDRLAEARGRGVAAALVAGPAGAAAAAGLASPPLSRVHAPSGVAPLLAAALVAVGAFGVPARSPRSPVDAKPDAKAARTGAGSEAARAGRAEASADAQARAAAQRRAVREALGLPRDGVLDATEVAQRWASKDARAAAMAAAAGGDVAAALAADGPDAAETIARALGTEAAGRAEALRREALARRTSAGIGPVPPARRAMVARYLASQPTPSSSPETGLGDRK